MGLSDFSGGVQEALAEIIRDRLEREEVARRVEQQKFQNERALNTEGFRDRSLTEDTRRFDASHALNRDQHGLAVDQFDFTKQTYADGAPMRDASLAHTKAQTGDILRRPEAEQQERDHDVSMTNLSGTWGLRTIGAQGAEQRRTQSHGASLKGPETMSSDPAKAQQRVNDVRALAQELLDDPNLPSVFGMMRGRVPKVTQGATDTDAKVSRLQNLLTLDNLGLMKGVLSDTDIKILERAGTLLANRTISPEAAMQEIRRVLGGDAAQASSGRASGAGPGPGPARPSAADLIRKYSGGG